MKRILAIVSLLLLTQMASGAERIKRIVVLDFRNGSPDKQYDTLGLGLSETLLRRLSEVPTLTLLDRSRLPEVMNEFHISGSPLSVPGTGKQMGKILGADSLVDGTYTITGTTLQIEVKIIDVETTTVRVTAHAGGPLKDIEKLETELARQLIAGIQAAPLNLEPRPDRTFDAFAMFSDGLYFLRNNHIKDALARFDRALSLDPSYADAQFHRGLALEKLQRWDDAIEAFKDVLPRTKTEDRVTWSWQAPAGAIPFDEADQATLKKRILFADRKDQTTTVYLPDLVQHQVQQLALSDARLSFRNGRAIANDRMTLLFAFDPAKADQLGLYAVSRKDNSLWWHLEIPTPNGQLPVVGLTPDAFYTADLASRRLTLFDDQSPRQRWTRDDLAIDRLQPRPVVGDRMIVRTEDAYHAIRLSDGTDAWRVPAAPDSRAISNDRVLAVFEPKSRFFIVDIETGRMIKDLRIPPAVTFVNLGPYGTTGEVQAAIEGNTLVMISLAQEAVAVDLKAGLVRWKVPLRQKVSSLRVRGTRAYAATDTGELIAIDLAKGAIVTRTKLASGALTLDYAEKDFVVASADSGIFALEPSGRKRWGYPSGAAAKQVKVFKGIVVARTSPIQISMIAAKDGKVLFQVEGPQPAEVVLSEDAFFIADEKGIKEFSPSMTAVKDRRPADRQVLAELAGVLISTGKPEEARSYIDAAAAIDPNYPPLRLLLGDLAGYANLVGRGSREGQRAIAELKSKEGLIWATEVDPPLVGAPVILGKRLVNVARVPGFDTRLFGLDPLSGATVWRLPAERVIDTVVDDDGRAWYVSGQASNPAGLTLYQVDPASGERRELARWTRPRAINAVYMTHTSNRLFVASVALEFQGAVIHGGIDCFDAISGERLWQTSHDVPVPLTDLPYPLGLFMTQGENLVYSFGHEIFAVRVADGDIVDRQHEPSIIGDAVLRNPAPAGPMYYYTNRKEREVVAYDVARRELTRIPRPDDDASLLVLDGVLYGYDVDAAYAFDLKGRELWRVSGKFRLLLDSETRIFALTRDNLILELDRVTGKVLAEHKTFWRPSGFLVAADRIYLFSLDGLEYCIKR